MLYELHSFRIIVIVFLRTIITSNLTMVLLDFSRELTVKDLASFDCMESTEAESDLNQLERLIIL